MAQKIVVTLTDDITGEEANETVEFGLDGVGYEIDLATAGADVLRDVIAPYVAAARRVAGGRKSGNTKKQSVGTVRDIIASKTGDARLWALTPVGAKAIKAAGLKLPAAHGAVAAPVVALYESHKATEGAPKAQIVEPEPSPQVPAEAAPEPVMVAAKPAPRKRPVKRTVPRGNL